MSSVLTFSIGPLDGGRGISLRSLLRRFYRRYDVVELLHNRGNGGLVAADPICDRRCRRSLELPTLHRLSDEPKALHHGDIEFSFVYLQTMQLVNPRSHGVFFCKSIILIPKSRMIAGARFMQPANGRESKYKQLLRFASQISPASFRIFSWRALRWVQPFPPVFDPATWCKERARPSNRRIHNFRTGQFSVSAFHRSIHAV